MPTMQVTRKTRLEPNHVYVIPPNRSILMTDAHLDIREFEEPHGHRTPVDLFFRSMDIATRHGDGTTVVIRVPAGQVFS
jgi:two-component system CheB/CheR fusion protein